MTIWTDEDDTRLRLYRSEGMSYGDMEERHAFPGKTRNAIIGRAARIGLSEKLGPRAGRPAMPKAKRAPKPRPYVPRQPSLFDQLAVLPALELPADYSEFAITFFDAKANDGKCRYPIGETSDLDEFRFCGDQVTGEHSYCVRHYLLTHMPLPKPPLRGGNRERANGYVCSAEPDRAA